MIEVASCREHWGAFPGSGQSIGQITVELLKAKTAANRRPSYLRALRVYLRRFMRGREERPLRTFDTHMIEDWLGSVGNAWTRKSGLALLSVLFSFAERRGYIERNPCRRVERVSVERPAPQVLSPKEARRLLNAARRNRWIRQRVPEIVLGLYAGVRNGEMTRLYWKDIDLERGFLRIDAAAAKTRRRRIVALDPKAIAWLRRCKPNARPIGTTSRTWHKTIEALTGQPWSPNVLRHTAASYLLAKYADVGKVSRMLGNTADVLLTHYVELISPQDCRRFWKCPKAVK